MGWLTGFTRIVNLQCPFKSALQIHQPSVRRHVPLLQCIFPSGWQPKQVLSNDTLQTRWPPLSFTCNLKYIYFLSFILSLCQRQVLFIYGIFIFFSNERSHNTHLLFTHKDVFYYWARIYEPVLINECESRDICRLNKFHQSWMKKEDIQFIIEQLINSLSCIVNLDKTTLLYCFFKAKCCLYC